MTKFKVGDRVTVKYGYGWDGTGVIEEIILCINPTYDVYDVYDVKFDRRVGSYERGGFDQKYLTLITTGSAYLAGAEAARKIALAKGTVNADDVQAELARQGYSSADLGNAAGAIFRNNNFRKVGEARSVRKQNRGRKIAQWELAR